MVSYKSQLDIAGRGNSLHSMVSNGFQAGGRHVFEVKMPSLFKATKSSFEVNVGFRAKFRSPREILDGFFNNK